MDQIYLRAYLTIISCSDDAGQGLPGVRRLARDPQHSLWLGDRKLEHIYSPAESVGQSRWITRGWTYQEGFMSRRKLFFTRQGVALWCRSMYYEEGVSRSNPDIDEVQEDLVPRIMEGVAPKSLSEHRFELVISKYTMRRVTYEGDTLNACLGILNYLGYKHLWGIVIREQPFSLELCWVPLRNDVPEQEAFPSWSWTRWGSAVKLHPQKYPSSIASIKTRLPSGEEFDILRDTLYTGDLGAICSGKMLRVTGTFLTSPRFSVLEDHGNIYCSIVLSCACGAEIRMMRVNLDMSMGSYASTAAYLDGTEVLEVTPLYKDAKGLFSGQFLLVKRHMDAYRRIGVGGYDEDHWIRHDCRTFKLFGGGFVPMKGCYTKTIDLI